AAQRATVAAALAEATAAAENSPVLNRISTAWRNVPSQPRVREYEGDIRVEYGNRQGRLVSDAATVVSVSADAVVLEHEGVTEQYEVAVGEGFVDVSGPHGTYSFTPVPVFVDPADVVVEGSLLAPMPASVVEVSVTDGQAVSKGDTIVILEAMKMQHTLSAPRDGVVTGLRVSVGAQVESGAVIAIIEEGTEA